jgi:hypothetical protein
VIKSYRLFPLSPSTYCTAKVNSLGCTPAISFSGTPKAIPAPSASPRATSSTRRPACSSTRTRRLGVVPGGFKCAADPVRRTARSDSGGSTSGSSCTGTYSLDFNARIASGVDPSLVAGAEDLRAVLVARSEQPEPHEPVERAALRDHP